MSLKPTQRSLRKWTKQEWQYSSDQEQDKPRTNRGRYLPKNAWKSLSAGEKRATNSAKRKTSGQFSKQPKRIAKKTAKYRK